MRLLKFLSFFSVFCLADLIQLLYELNENRTDSYLEKVELALDEGTLIGYQTTAKVFAGKKYEYFKQVPYAKSPTGSCRFRKPEPIGSFANGTHDSAAVGNKVGACPGLGFGPEDLQPALEAGTITEDCLTLDIYRPVFTNKSSLPIFIWIHGGGLTLGTSAYYHFSSLTREDIIIAVVQYRLGVHGFLSSFSSTGQTETPGNFGLLDQQAAIEFVHRNAKNLGGDPAKITIGGESAGGWSIGWQMLSPKTTSMIRTAISQSGMATFNMSNQDSEAGNIAIQRLCEKMNGKFQTGLNCGEAEEIIDQFRELTTEQILELQTADQECNREFENYPAWSPVSHDGVFFEKNAQEKLEKGDVATNVGYIIGTNSFEGSVIWPFLPGVVESYDDRLAVFGFMTTRSETEDQQEEIFENYFRILQSEDWLSCTEITNCTSYEYKLLAATIIGDLAFVLPAFEQALLYSDKGAYTAVYYLNIDMLFDPFMYDEVFGTGHAEDLMFLMDVPRMEIERNGVNKTLWELFHSPADSPYPPTEYMYQMNGIFLNHWASIIKTGKPASPWNEFNRKNMNYVEWSNNATNAIETIQSGLPPTVKYMIETFGKKESSSAKVISASFISVVGLIFLLV